MPRKKDDFETKIYKTENLFQVFIAMHHRQVSAKYGSSFDRDQRRSSKPILSCRFELSKLRCLFYLMETGDGKGA